jgi:hypothetical protein
MCYRKEGKISRQREKEATRKERMKINARNDWIEYRSNARNLKVEKLIPLRN